MVLVCLQDPSSSQTQQEDDSEGLTEGLRKLSMTTPTYRYHGKYSALVLIRTIVDVKGRVLEEANEEPEPTLLHRDYQNRPVCSSLPQCYGGAHNAGRSGSI